MNGELSRSTHHINNDQLSQIAKHKLYEIKHELNSSIGGAYLFSGSIVDKPAVDDIEDIDQYYQGNEEIHSAKLGEFFELKYGVTADDQSFIDLITCAQLTIKIKDDHSILTEAKVCIEKAIPALINLQQKVSNDYTMTMRYRQLHEDKKLELLQLRHKIEDKYSGDLPELISEFTLQESVLKASQLILSKLMNLSLASSMR